MKGALATVDKGSGHPYASLVLTATDQQGLPLLLISKLALHTQNIAGDKRASLLIDATGAGDSGEDPPKDPMQGARLTLIGEMEPAPDANANTGNQTTVDTATLSVTPDEAKTLALADLNATLRLDLRSPKDVNHGEKADKLVLDGGPVAAAAPAPAAGPATPPAAAPASKILRTGILIIDGDQVVGR